MRGDGDIDGSVELERGRERMLRRGDERRPQTVCGDGVGRGSAGGIALRPGYALILRRADTGLLACQLGGGGRACGPRGDAVRAGVAHGWKSGWRGCRIVHGPDGEQVGGVNVCRLHVNAGSNGVGGLATAREMGGGSGRLCCWRRRQAGVPGGAWLYSSCQTE